jgi:hypothetical protein
VTDIYTREVLPVTTHGDNGILEPVERCFVGEKAIKSVTSH